MRRCFIYIAMLVGMTACANRELEMNIPRLTQEEKQKGILTPEVLWKLGRLQSISVNPEGTQVAYAVRYFDVAKNKGYSYLMLAAVDGKTKPHPLTEGLSAISNLQWSSDGKMLFFLASSGKKTRIWRWMSKINRTVSIVNEVGEIESFKISPDAKKVVFEQKVKVKPLTAKDKYPEYPQAQVRMYDDLMIRHWDTWDEGNYSHLFIADFNNGKILNPKDIQINEAWDTPRFLGNGMADISWSPDAKRLYYSTKKMTGMQYALSTDAQIFVYSLEKSKTKELTPNMLGYDMQPVVSPNGKLLAFQSLPRAGSESDKKRLMLLNLENGAMKDLTEGFDQNIDQFAWSKNSKKIWCLSGINATEQLYELDINTACFQQITSGAQDFESIDVAKGALVVSKKSLSMSPEVFVIHPGSGAERNLSNINTNIYKNITMGKVETRWMKTVDDKQMLTYIVYPPHFDPNKKYPALLYCQGGPQNTVSQFFSYRWNLQVMAAQGYIVIAPNRRGTPSFGQAWTDQISGDYSGLNIQDYLTATDEMAKEPFVDKDRMAAVGASYGGYSVFYLAGVHNKRFKAFIAHCGIFNFESMYLSTEELFFVNADLGGPYWDNANATAQRSFANSPHKLVDKWDTPIMIITGEHDYRIPYTESLQAFTAAKLRGVPARLLVFPDETHLVTKPQNSLVWQKEFFEWLDKYLKN